MIIVSLHSCQKAISLKFQYDIAKVEIMRELRSFNHGKSAWNPDNKTWNFKLNILPELKRRFNDELCIPDNVEAAFLEFVDEDNSEAGWRKRLRAVSDQKLADYESWLASENDVKSQIGETLLSKLDLDKEYGGHKLFAHQVAGIKKLCQNQRTLLAGEVGTAKTRQALLFAKAHYEAFGTKTIVLCRFYLIRNWLAEADTVGLEIEPYSSHCNKIPEPPILPYVLLTDESHDFKGPGSQRTKKFLELAAKAQGIVELSGTPLANGRPIDFWTTLVALKHPLATRGKSAYEKRYCDGHLEEIYRKNKPMLRVWKNTGESNIDELRQEVAPWIIIQKKSECVDLPPVSYVRIEVHEDAESQGTFLCFYLSRLAQARKEREEKIAKKRQEGEKISREDEEELLEVEAVAKDIFMRQGISLAKIKTAVELTRDCNASLAQVLIFCAFKETAEQAAQDLECPFITSDVAPGHRQDLVNKFNSGQVDNLVLTYGSGEAGLNLQAASVVIRLDRVWLWASNEQAVGRAHRIGQEHKVTVYDLLYGPLDKGMLEILTAKEANVTSLLGSRLEQEPSENIEDVKKRLVRTVEESYDLTKEEELCQ